MFIPMLSHFNTKEKLRTSGRESGFLPTPVANDDGKTPEAHMRMKANMAGGERHKPTSLTVMVKGVESGELKQIAERV
jgi:hypothetical protein